MVNMATSVDGATAAGGRSGSLGGPTDRKMFAAVRALADAILVGAATVRAERYRPPDSVEGHLGQRLELGHQEGARLIVVSASGRLDDDSPILDAPILDSPTAARPILLTAAPVDELSPRVASVFDIRTIDDHGALARRIGELVDEGVDTVLCEGGPRLLGMLVDLDLVDEWLLTTGPSIRGGDSRRMVHGAAETERPLLLDRIWHDDTGAIFARYLTDR